METTEYTLKDLVEQFSKIETASQSLQVKVEEAAQIINRQSRMLEIALDEMIALLQTEAIPPFFRLQISGALTKMKEVGTPGIKIAP